MKDINNINIWKKITFCNLALSPSLRYLNYRYLFLIYKSFIVNFLIYHKYTLYISNKTCKKRIAQKLLNCGSIIHNCKYKYVVDPIFNLNYILIFYLKRFIAKILSDKCHKLINFVKPKGRTHNTRGINIRAQVFHQHVSPMAVLSSTARSRQHLRIQLS